MCNVQWTMSNAQEISAQSLFARRTTMTIQQLQYVIAIAEAGSMNKAAERLYVSQPTLTGAIKDLEKAVPRVL